MSDLRALVFTALDNAKENGYELEATDEDVAINLLDYDVDIWEASTAEGDKTGQDYTVMDLIPFIEEYRKLQ